MSLSLIELALYAGAVFVLFLTPGPVWVALLARSMSGGVPAAWPLAAGVMVGDVLWPLLAILGVSWLVGEVESFLVILRYFAAVIFLAMGIALILKAESAIGSDSRLTRPGVWAGFLAGVLVILGNPKAVLFYMGVLPGFFDLSLVTTTDIVLICLVSMIVPFVSNLILAAFVSRVRQFLASPGAVRRLNVISGCLLIGVGLIIPFT